MAKHAVSLQYKTTDFLMHAIQKASDMFRWLLPGITPQTHSLFQSIKQNNHKNIALLHLECNLV